MHSTFKNDIRTAGTPSLALALRRFAFLLRPRDVVAFAFAIIALL
jgi:hypothetical protein